MGIFQSLPNNKNNPSSSNKAQDEHALADEEEESSATIALDDDDDDEDDVDDDNDHDDSIASLQNSQIAAAPRTQYQSKDEIILENDIWGFRSNIESLILPKENITTLPPDCLRNAFNLHTIQLPSSLTSIESNAFSRNISLTKLNIPDSVTHIQSDAFFCCCNLKYLSIPDDAFVEVGAFNGCTKLQEISSANYMSVSDYYRDRLVRNRLRFLVLAALVYEGGEGNGGFGHVVVEESMLNGPLAIQMIGTEENCVRRIVMFL